MRTVASQELLKGVMSSLEVNQAGKPKGVRYCNSLDGTERNFAFSVSL